MAPSTAAEIAVQAHRLADFAASGGRHENAARWLTLAAHAERIVGGGRVRELGLGFQLPQDGGDDGADRFHRGLHFGATAGEAK